MIESTPEGKLLNLIRKSQSKIKLGDDLKIFTKVNILLIGFIAIVAVVFMADMFIFKEKPLTEPVQAKVTQVSQVQPISRESVEEDNAMDQAFPDKNISIKKISREEVLGNFTLLGIITGDNNQAIIEDKVLKKTFFLYKDDSLGDFKVYDIKDSVVILEYKGEKIELNI
ncbi:MAG: hypothetical protein NTV71_02355 [Candidatus Omnitrophica bacterium]|nr:hypothetical protein [Candidatus Omnitrophota bacterium]